MSTVTMQELEHETAELLPARETLWCSSGGHNHTTIVGSGNGNTEQNGLVNVAFLNGNLNGDGNLIFG
jgi:hypothetical protein